ncbi:hypothetical protein EON65_38475 [archaeon]|nr:MAG: hypothetical protein EON65_38475 [archaeon]
MYINYLNTTLYRLQDDGEDVFKMGRSTGKLFKEKGVSLYKDKEISTTHAKVSTGECPLCMVIYVDASLSICLCVCMNICLYI